LIIELHNGRELTTSRVWDEGDELKFSASAGTAGVPRALVKRMKTSTPVSHDTRSSSALSPTTSHPTVPTTQRPVQANSHREPESPQEGGHRQAPHAQHLESAKSFGAGDAHAYRAKKLTLTGELEAV
jgi:hypothetical protein